MWLLLLRLPLTSLPLSMSTAPLTGVAIRTYLLERSRVVNINDPERNYHVFYQVQHPPARPPECLPSCPACSAWGPFTDLAAAPLLL